MKQITIITPSGDLWDGWERTCIKADEGQVWIKAFNGFMISGYPCCTIQSQYKPLS